MLQKYAEKHKKFILKAQSDGLLILFPVKTRLRGIWFLPAGRLSFLFIELQCAAYILMGVQNHGFNLIVDIMFVLQFKKPT